MTYFTLVFGDFVFESFLATGVELDVVPAEDFQGLLVRALGCVVVGHRVAAVVRQVLLAVRRQQLQEGHLVAVRLVGELEAGVHLREPNLETKANHVTIHSTKKLLQSFSLAIVPQYQPQKVRLNLVKYRN